MSFVSLLNQSAELYHRSTGSQNEYNIPSIDFSDEAAATFDISLHPKPEKSKTGAYGRIDEALKDYSHKIFCEHRADVLVCDRLKISSIWYEVLGTTNPCGRSHHIKIFAKKIEVSE